MTLQTVGDAIKTSPKFQQLLEEYQRNKDKPRAEPVIEPPPNKPLHLLTEDELRRGVQACDFCQGRGYYSLDVVVTDERFGRLLACPHCQPYQIELKRRETNARLLPRLAPYTLLRGKLLEHEFANFDQARAPAAYNAIYNWAKFVYGKGDSLPWVYVYGDTGNGKTHLLAAAANGLTRASIPLIFATMPDTLAMILDAEFEMRETIIRYLQTVPVLIIDDFGTEKGTDYKVETIFRIINWRYTELCPTLFSSNIPPAYLSEMRVASRIMDKAISKVVLNDGKSYRELDVADRVKG